MKPSKSAIARPSGGTEPRALQSVQIASSALFRSSIKSRTSSTPTDSRTSESVMPSFSPLFFRHGGMRHQRRMIDQAFHAAQAFRQSKQVRVLKKTPRSGEVSFQNDGDHPAEPAHLLPGQIVLWMRFQSRIMD